MKASSYTLQAAGGNTVREPPVRQLLKYSDRYRGWRNYHGDSKSNCDTHA